MKMKIGLIAAAFTVVMALFGAAALFGPAEVMGIVARQGDASIEAKAGSFADGKVMISRVVAPADSFVVVHLAKDDGMPGTRIGVVPVKAGTSTDVAVPLSTDKLTGQIIAAVHIDRGKAGELEFDMKDAEHSPDRPFFVNGKEVATMFSPTEAGGAAESGGMK